MNTPESDRLQAEYGRAWIRKKAKKKMDKMEKKLAAVAKQYFGEDVAIIYARKGAVVVDKHGTEFTVDPGGKK